MKVARFVFAIIVGKLLVGISTLIFVIALISGVVIWWPRARKNFRHSMAITFKDGWRGLWKSLHVAGGMYALVFVLAMSLTGLTWSFNWYRTAFYAVCGVGHTPRNFGASTTEKSVESGRSGEGRGNHRGGRRGENGEVRGEGRRHHSEYGRWQQVYDELKAQNPDAPQITVGAETASVTLGVTGNGRASDKYEFNRRSGEVTPVSKYADSVPADKLRGWIYAVHTGSWGGMLTRILWLLGALLGASLPLTGYYIWIKHLRHPKKHAKIRN